MKNNLPIIVGISLPVVIVLILLIILYVPTKTANPQHDFLFVTYDNYANSNRSYDKYVLEDGEVKFVKSTLTSTYAEVSNPTLYLYDVENDSVKEIDVEDTVGLEIDPGPTSPDGYIMEYDRNRNSGIIDIFGGYSNNRTLLLKNGRKTKELSIPSDILNDYYYYRSNSDALIGWIIN